MPVPSLISELFQTPGSNSPIGSVDAPSSLDDYQRTHAAFIATLRDGKGFTSSSTLASAATLNIGAQNSQFVDVTGSVTVTSLGTSYNGPRYLRFAAALILTHSASLALPGGINITTAAGDVALFVPKTTAGVVDGWAMAGIQRASGGLPVGNGGTGSTTAATARTALGAAPLDDPVFTTKVTSPLFRTTTGTSTAASGVAGTLYTAPSSINAIYMVAANIGVTNDPVNYAAFAIIMSDGSSLRRMTGVDGNLLAITISGLTVQGTQTTGSSQTMNATITRLG